MAGKKEIKRCAVYTRVSIEALEHEFNSLDAQRESAENYIKSQKENGWVILPEHYDDDGYSGGNTERPALKRLLADVEAGKIDIILIYKMDRLSRSLLDFMKLAEMLEKYDVSFVSVTQDINTSTSSGRMMLNILMTFSEYERDVVAERIRDKIAGAKRRGKFCGGAPILGYDTNHKTKKLEVNRSEALVVREIFEQYSKLGSSLDVIRVMDKKGYRTKDWVSKKGRHHTGKKFVPATIYRILNNVLYIGQVRHNEKCYDGEHEAIIDKKLWDKVQFILSENAPIAPGIKKTAIASPFKGLLVCGYCGGSFGITYTSKNGRRYMYYICMKDEDRTERQCPLGRVSAGEVDRLIFQQMERIFRTPSMLTKTFNHLAAMENERKEDLLKRKSKLENEMLDIRTQLQAGGDVMELRQQFATAGQIMEEVENELNELEKKFSYRELINICGSMEKIWEGLFPAERYKLAHQLIDRIALYTDRIVMDIRHGGLKSLSRELATGGDVTITIPNAPERSEDIIQLTVPMVIRRRRGHKLILAPGESDETWMEIQDKEYGPSSLALHLARAHTWTEMLESGKAGSVPQLAESVGMDQSYMVKIVKLVNLSPEIQRMIMEGREPESLTMAKLRKGIPADWREQREMYLTPQA